jgi:hypothetical protein
MDLPLTLTLNVGGRIFQTYPSTLMTYPETTLARCFASGLAKPNEKGEYFFDRNGTAFEAILEIYRTGQAICPPNVDPTAFNHELVYWGFDQLTVPVSVQKPDHGSIFNLDMVLLRVINLILRPHHFEKDMNLLDEHRHYLWRVEALAQRILQARQAGKSEITFLALPGKNHNDIAIIEQLFKLSQIQTNKYPVIEKADTGAYAGTSYYYIKNNTEHPVNYGHVFESQLNHFTNQPNDDPYVIEFICQL